MLITPDWPLPQGVSSLITTRTGGCSPRPYHSFNLALHVGDSSSLVANNRASLRAALPADPLWLEQVHGVELVCLEKDLPLFIEAPKADGIVSCVKHAVCAVMTADCLPLLLCAEDGSRVAALHCGWRSLAKGIIPRALEVFEPRNRAVMAYLGPAISSQHFEVGIDVFEAFQQAACKRQYAAEVASAFVPRDSLGLTSKPTFYADIYELARMELRALGVDAIYGGEYCSYEDSERFFSYRREGVTGRMASLIWMHD